MKTILLSKQELIEILDERLELKLKGIKQQSPPSINKVLLTRKDVAKIFGVSLVTVSAWTKQGIINPMRMGSRVYFYKSEIIEATETEKLLKRRRNEI